MTPNSGDKLKEKRERDSKSVDKKKYEGGPWALE